MPPDRKLQHFKPGRSAYELAVLYTKTGCPSVPTELRCILDSHEDTRGVIVERGKVERETPLPCSIRGNRCHDISLDGRLPLVEVFVSIEGKADERFGDTVANELKEAFRRSANTDFPRRLDCLTQYLLGIPAFNDPQRKVLNPAIQNVPYQLLAGVAATLLEAENRGARKAIFIVHEFRTAKTNYANMQRNAEALNSFLRLLLQSNGTVSDKFELESAHLLRFPVLPRAIRSGGAYLPDIPLYVGKIRTDLLLGTKG